jgi:hypothetical protein
MDESAGPYHHNCPVSYIEMVEAHERAHGYGPIGYAENWRKSVREYHAKSKRTFQPGQKIKLFGTEFTVGEPRRGGTYFIWDGTMQYHLPKRQFKHVEVA